MPRSLLAKRMMDIIGGGLGLVVLSPLFIVVAFAVVAESRGGVFFCQERVGLFGRPFKIIKFRSMVVNLQAKGPLLTARGDARITRVGAMLRRAKLDEMPQLFNVLAGNMSLVGPRPEVREYFALYSTEQKKIITSVKPGMTDFAAIELKDEETILSAYADRHKAYVEILMPRKFVLYEKYIEEQTLLLDMKLIWRTFTAIAKRNRT